MRKCAEGSLEANNKLRTRGDKKGGGREGNAGLDKRTQGGFKNPIALSCDGSRVKNEAKK